MATSISTNQFKAWYLRVFENKDRIEIHEFLTLFLQEFGSDPEIRQRIEEELYGYRTKLPTHDWEEVNETEDILPSVLKDKEKNGWKFKNE